MMKRLIHRPQRTRSTATLCILVFSLMAIPASLSARGDRMYVLPFRISGKPPASLFEEAELPTQTQQAAVFLARLLRDYNSLAFRAPGSEADRSQGLDEEAARNRMTSFCAAQDASHVLGGRILFTGKTELTVETFTASCARRAVLYRDRNSGSLNELQTLMRKGIFRVTPFLPENPAYSRIQRLDEVRDRHTHVLVDLSGSMELTLPFIRKGLEQLEPSPERKVTLTAVGSGSRIENAGPFTDKQSYLRLIRNLHGSGEIKENDLIEALHRSRDAMAPGTTRLLLFTDQTLSEKGLLQLQKELGEIRRSGIQTAFFSAYASDPAFLEHTGRFERIATVFEPIFARRAGYVNGESYFFVRKGAAYHLCSGAAADDIASGRIDLKQCRPFPAYRYTKEELDLDRLPEAYAKRNNLSVSGIGPVFSDLEFRIEDFLTDRTGPRSPYRVLAQSGRQAFWIGLSRRSDYEALVDKKGKKLYIGLHLKRTPAGPENLPAAVHLLPDGDVPRLFLLDYGDLLVREKNRLNVRDAWFFLVEIRDYRHE